MRPPRDLTTTEEKALKVFEGSEDVESALRAIMNKWPFLSIDFLEWLVGESEGWT